MKAGWATLQTSDSMYELLPSHDVIEHKKGIVCSCNPEVTSWIDDNGKVIWGVSHNSFDEYLDDDLTEPYKGL